MESDQQPVASLDSPKETSNESTAVHVESGPSDDSSASADSSSNAPLDAEESALAAHQAKEWSGDAVLDDSKHEGETMNDMAAENEVAEESIGDAVATLDAESQPFVGRWNQLISSTNWEKGRIICDWRNNLQASGVGANEFSDEAWARRVGGVTAPHVGRLRRVFEAFGGQHETYPGLYWSHFLAALDWDDAPLWLEGAVRSGWSISQMRNQRWEASGGRVEDQPKASDLIESDTDEDVVMPAQGGGREGRFDDEPGGVSAGPSPEGPDFGDESYDGAAELPEPVAKAEGETENLDGPGTASLVQPFAGLPDLPDDMTEALEMFKLSIIRHKATGWTLIAPESVVQVLEALRILVTSRSE
jgi:hypothetical protein